MKVIIENKLFPLHAGVRLLKTIHSECTFPELAEIWDRIEPLSFAEIHHHFKDIDQKRIAFRCLGLERFISDVKPQLVSKETVEKTTIWVEPDGSLKTYSYSDTYELHVVRWINLYGYKDPTEVPLEFKVNNYFVKCRDTSTGEENVLWVDIADVYRTNLADYTGKIAGSGTKKSLEEIVNPIEAIAWTIMTDIPKGNIKRIIRQGDCILIQPIYKRYYVTEPRHLTGQEYRTLMYGEA